MSRPLPPRWKELEEDERYKTLSTNQRLKLFNQWSTDMRDIGAENNYWEDEETRGKFSNLVKTKLTEFGNQAAEEEKSGLVPDLQAAGARFGMGLAGAPYRLSGVASDVLLTASKAIDFVPSQVAKGLDTLFDTNLSKPFEEGGSWLTRQLRTASEANQASIRNWDEKSRRVAENLSADGGGELGDLGGMLGAATADAAIDVGTALATGGASIPARLATSPRTTGLLKGVLDDAIETFTGPTGQNLRTAATLGASRSYSGAWNEAINQYVQEDGLTRQQAENKALPEALNAGASTYLITTLGGRTGVESLLKKQGATGLKDRVRSILDESFSEALEEGADESLQDLAERWTRNPNKAVEDSVKEIKYGFGLGALLGGGFASVGQTIEKLQETGSDQTAQVLRDKMTDPEKIKERVMQIKTDLDEKFGPDDDTRLDALMDEIGDNEADIADPPRQTIALPPQRMGVQTLPDDTVTAPEVDTTADVFANVPRQDGVPAAGRYTPQGLAALSDAELDAEEQSLSLATNTEAVAESRGETPGLAALSQEALNRVRAEKQRRGRVIPGPEGATIGPAPTPASVTPAAVTPTPAPATPAPELAVAEDTQPRTLDQFTDDELDQESTILERQAENETDPVRVEEINTQIQAVAAERQRRTAPPVAPAPAAPSIAATTPPPAAPAPAPSAPGVTNTQPTAALPDNQAETVAPTPASAPVTPAPAPASEPEAVQPQIAAAPTPDAQAYEDSLVAEARNAGTKITGRKALQIKEEIKGKGWYPKQNVNKAVAGIRERVRQRLEAEPAPPPVANQAPTAAPDPVAESLPDDARALIRESRNKGEVPSSTTINARYGESGTVQPLSEEQRRSVRREAARQVAEDYGIPYDENLEFNKDFDGRDSIPVRVTETGTAPVFVNDPDVTARQLDQGLIPTVPESQRSNVVGGIEFDPETGRVTSARSRGVDVRLPGQLESAVRGQRPGSRVDTPLTSEKETQKMAAQSRKFNRQDLADYREVAAAIANMSPRSPQIGQRFSVDDLASKALSIWVNERTKDKQRAADKRKNYTAQQVWAFANEKAFDKVKNLPMQVSLDAPVGDSGGARIENVRATEEGNKDQADREAADDIDASIEEGVIVDEPTNLRGPVRGASTGMNYNQAYSIINSPRMLEGAPEDQVNRLKTEAQELLDLAPQNVIDDLEANDVDYWTWTAEDFRNVDTGNTGEVVSGSPRAKSPYISEQTSWLQSVARALNMRNAGEFTPGQRNALAVYFANKYRPTFESGATQLPEGAVRSDLSEVRALFESPGAETSSLDRLVETLKTRYPGATVRYSTKENSAGWVNTRFRNTIFLNPLILEQEVDGLSEAEMSPFIEALMDEEYIHMIESQTVPEEFAIAIAQRLPENIRRQVLDRYANPDRFDTEAERQAFIDSLSDSQIGSEYIRMVMQRLRKGQTTEDLIPDNLPQNLFEQLMQYIQAIVERLKARLEVFRDPVLAHTIRAIESGMRVAEIRQELRQANPQELETMRNNPDIARFLFTGPRNVAEAENRGQPDYAEEAAKVKLGKSYWINMDGRVIDVVEEDADGTNATHGRYIRNWVNDRLTKFFPGKFEKDIARVIETRARELMVENPDLREELDQEAVEDAYQEAVYLNEALGIDPPDLDQFRSDAFNKLGPSDMAYNEAAIEAGWARIAVPSRFSSESPIQIQVYQDKLRRGPRQTIEELGTLRKTSVVEDGALRNRAVDRMAFVTRIRDFRGLPGRARGRRAVAAPREKGGLLRNIMAMVTGRYSETKTRTGGFFSSGKLTPLERDILQRPRHKISEAAAAIEYTVGEFRRAVKQAFPDGNAPTDLINQAFGSAPNPLTDQQVADLKKIKDPDERDAKRAEFKSLNRQKAKADRVNALGQLPAPVAKWVERMRSKVDELSKTMMENGYIPESLIPVFDENLELYFHREYLIFESKEWRENMLNPQTEDHVRIRVAAEKLFRDQAVAERAVELMRVAREQNQPITRAEAKQRARADIPFLEQRINDLVLEYLSVADAGARSFFTTGRVPGQRNMGIIKVRGQIPKEIREFWGEIKDAETNFAQTVSKMAAFIAQHDAATELLQHGIESGYIWKRNYDNRSVFNGKTRKWDVILGDQRKEGFDTKEQAEAWRASEYPKVQNKLQAGVAPAGFVPLIDSGQANPKSIEPLDGAYGPPELRDVLTQLTTPRETAAFYRGVSFLTAMFMAMKTIGYFPQAYVRNLLSNPFGQLISGGINVQNWGSMGRAFQTGVDVARLNSGLRWKLQGVENVQQLREKLLRLGVLQDNPRGYFLKMLYEESIEGPVIQELLNRKEFKTVGEKVGAKVVQGANAAFMKMADIYQGIDDMWKAYGWLMEMENQRRAHPDWTQEQLETKSAEQIRDMVWTYSMSPDVTKSIRRIPVLAPFITWTSEVIRATSNAVSIANEEMRVGKETGNRAMYLNGVNRRVGQIVAFALLPALAQSMKYILGYDDEDEEALRTLLPEWQQNAQLVLLPKLDTGNQEFYDDRDGKILYVDLSYLDPLQVFKEPGIAMLRSFWRGDSLAEIAGETASQVFAPVLSEQLFFGTVADLARNRRADGTPIWNEMDTAANKTRAMIWHVVERGGPGMVVGTAPRIYKAATGEVSPSGRSFSLGAELTAPVTGQRISEIDAQTSLRQAVGRYKGKMSQSTQLLSNLMTSRGTVNSADIPAAYDNANRAKQSAFEEIVQFYNSALKLGVPENAAVQILKGVDFETGLSQDALASVISGQYVPYQPSEQMINRALVQPNGEARVDALLNHLKKVNEQPGDN